MHLAAYELTTALLSYACSTAVPQPLPPWPRCKSYPGVDCDVRLFRVPPDLVFAAEDVEALVLAVRAVAGDDEAAENFSLERIFVKLIFVVADWLKSLRALHSKEIKTPVIIDSMNY